MKIKSLLMLGTLPPPIGGVTISVKNLKDALESKGIFVGLIFKGLTTTYDIAHIHAYSPLKRLLLTLIGRVFAHKVIFTIHGMHFDEINLFNRLTLRLSHGVVILNHDIIKRAPMLKKLPILKVTSIVKEGVVKPLNNQPILPENKEKPRLLVYAQHGDSFDGEPIYGIPFIESLLPELTNKYQVILVDITNSYPNFGDRFLENDVIHIKEAINFHQLLQEVDVYIRPTSKDGDAIAIREALMYQIPVIASDVVSRPNQCVTYKYFDKEDFLKNLESIRSRQPDFSEQSISSVEEYMCFFEQLNYKNKL